jgi:hypothetical protein
MTASPDYGVLPVHPLIKGLAFALAPGTKTSPNKLAEATAAAIAAKADWAPEATADAIPKEERSDPASGQNSLPRFIESQRAAVVVFAGYLGPGTVGPTGTVWRFLYQDAKAVSWLLVPEHAIVLHDRADDKRAAFQKRDLIWVRADAPVRQGTQEESEQARFLTGTFTNAGDLHATLSDADPAPPGSGILCAPTPGCCGRPTR